MTTLLNAINDQLAEQGLYIKAGEVSIIAASVIEAKQCRPHKRADGSSTQDPEAAWNVKAGSDGKRKSTYGYKAHINVDEEGLIKALAYTAGNVHSLMLKSSYLLEAVKCHASSLSNYCPKYTSACHSAG